jgi:hypothetical protein
MTNKKYISLGFQCTVPTVFQYLGVKNETLPFDWMLSSPKFVYEMLFLLMEENMSIPELVTNHFFKCDKRCTLVRDMNNNVVVEHYITDPNGDSLYNEQYDVIFPHDLYDIDHIQKYIRRFERLYNLIKNYNDLIYIYISPSSNQEGNFLIDGRNILNDTDLYLNKIYDLLLNKSNNQNFEFKTLLTNQPDSIGLYDKIQYINIEPKPLWVEIVGECVHKLR